MVMGEKDILKILQLLPGSRVLERDIRDNVRGSPADQNIFLYK